MVERIKRFFIDSKKQMTLILYSAFILIIFLMSWELHFFSPYASQAAPAPLMSYQWDEAPADFIPEESIRLRIKSHSQSPVDQKVKLAVRNEVNRAVTNWTGELENLDSARDVIHKRLHELEDVVEHELLRFGVHSSFKVSLKETDFPVKQYGERLYPAGTYEAVFIEIGDGLGDNWWCVLFPPLCFVEMGWSDAEAESHSPDKEGKTKEEDVTVSFFVVEVVQSLWERLM